MITYICMFTIQLGIFCLLVIFVMVANYIVTNTHQLICIYSKCDIDI